MTRKVPTLKPVDMTPAQLACYRLWCDLRGGEHHVTETVRPWSDDGIQLVLKHCGSRLSTTDGWDLTQLVVMAHDRAIRAEVGTGGFRLFVALTKRKREGEWFERHPDLETNVAEIRDSLTRRGPSRIWRVDL